MGEDARRGADVAIDFRAVVRASPDRYLVLSPELVILEVSDSYLRVTMTRRAEIVGRHVLDVFPGEPDDREGGAAPDFRASVGQVLATAQPHAMAVQRNLIRRPAAEGGALEERYWRPVNTPVLDATGAVTCILHRVEDVTDLGRLEREKLAADRTVNELAAASDRYAGLLDTAPDAIVIVGEDARIQLVNVQAERLFGYVRDELIGEPLELLIPERFRGAHAGHLRRYFAEPTARPMGSALQLHGRRKDASELPIEVSLSPQRGPHGISVSASIRDISERLQLEHAARLTSDRLANAVESIHDALALFDAEDRLILCNSAYRQLVHERTATGLVGKGYAALLDAWLDDIEFPDAAARARFRADRLAQRGHEPTTAFNVRMRDGRSLRVMDRRTAEGGLVKTIWDLTDDERRAEELRAARAAAETANGAKSEFLSSMSHELRTPLNAILGFAQLLEGDKREPLSARHRPRVEHILRGGEHLLRLIDDVLDLSKIEAGRLSLALETVDVAVVLDEVRRTLEPIAARQGIGLALDAVPAGLPAVIADRTRFAQILMNFGSNAIKYNRPHGEVRFAAVAAAGGALRITVTDTGMGIPLAQQAKLFQPFQRAGQEAGPIEGTGIGLVITRRLAELMAGRVGFRSVPNVGSEFWVELPVARDAQPILPPPLPAHAAARAGGGAVRRHLVLYVEDNAANVMFMHDLMSTFETVELVTVPTAELGVELARARRPSLVLMDLNLPGMSGLEALRALRSSPETARIPVIALTAMASDHDRQLGLAAGFARYVTKPIKVDELTELLEALLAA